MLCPCKFAVRNVTFGSKLKMKRVNIPLISVEDGTFRTLNRVLRKPFKPTDDNGLSVKFRVAM